MNDQYGHVIPFDRLVIPEDVLNGEYGGDDVETTAQHDQIMEATWYCACDDGHVILVNYDEAEAAGEAAPADAGITTATKLYRVAEPLKRHDTALGFYHA